MFEIEDYIPEGYDNRVSRDYLRQILHIPDRTVRDAIADAQDRGVLIVSFDGGYFRRKDESDDPYIRAYMNTENRRFKSMSHKNKRLREAWRAIHADDDGKQIAGQMSFVW